MMTDYRSKPRRRCTDLDVDKCVFWLAVAIFAVALAIP